MVRDPFRPVSDISSLPLSIWSRTVSRSEARNFAAPKTNPNELNITICQFQILRDVALGDWVSGTMDKRMEILTPGNCV